MSLQAPFTTEVQKLIAEKRAGVRFAPTSSPNLVKDWDGGVWSAEVLNLSADGIGLLVNRRFDRGDLLSLDLPSKNELGSQRLTGLVVNVDAHDEGHWRVGCKFARRLTPTELLALL